MGGNLGTFTLLQGTAYRPSLADALLVVEEDASAGPADVARHLTSLLQLPDAGGITGVVIGRFQRASGVTRALLEQILDRQPLADGVPVLAGVDVGHTSPLVTLPIGGDAELVVGDRCRFRLTRH